MTDAATDAPPAAAGSEVAVVEAAEKRLAEKGDTLDTFTGMQELAKSIAGTEFVPVGLRNRPDAVLASILTGRELGIGPMQALRQIYVTEDGKVGLEAELMLAKMREADIRVDGDVDDERAWVQGTRPNGEVMRLEFTLEEAQRANLLRKTNWTRYPKDMMWARAVSRLYRRLASDVAAGASHTPEELGVIDSDVVFQPPAEDIAPTDDVARLRRCLEFVAENAEDERMRDRWNEAAVLKQAIRSFRTTITKLEDLTRTELDAIKAALLKDGFNADAPEFDEPALEGEIEEPEPEAA